MIGEMVYTSRPILLLPRPILRRLSVVEVHEVQYTSVANGVNCSCMVQ